MKWLCKIIGHRWDSHGDICGKWDCKRCGKVKLAIKWPPPPDCGDKTFHGGAVTLDGSNSPSSLTSAAIRECVKQEQNRKIMGALEGSRICLEKGLKGSALLLLDAAKEMVLSPTERDAEMLSVVRIAEMIAMEGDPQKLEAARALNIRPTTVSQLVAALAKYPKDARVGIETACCSSGDQALEVEFQGARVWITESKEKA